MITFFPTPTNITKEYTTLKMNEKNLKSIENLVIKIEKFAI